MSKHTPGPWTAKQYAGKRVISIFPIAGPTFATLDVGPKARRDIQEANARLIAAAPEMFEALMQICQLTVDIMNMPPGPDADRKRNLIGNIAERAIVKAEGKS